MELPASNENASYSLSGPEMGIINVWDDNTKPQVKHVSIITRMLNDVKYLEPFLPNTFSSKDFEASLKELVVSFNTFDTEDDKTVLVEL